MLTLAVLLHLAQDVVVPAESGEVHLRNVRQLTFGGQNAEAYFSAWGRLLIFQRHGPAEQWEHAFPMFSRDGTEVVWASNRRGTAPHETDNFLADWVERR